MHCALCTVSLTPWRGTFYLFSLQIVGKESYICLDSRTARTLSAARSRDMFQGQAGWIVTWIVIDTSYRTRPLLSFSSNTVDSTSTVHQSALGHYTNIEHIRYRDDSSRDSRLVHGWSLDLPPERDVSLCGAGGGGQSKTHASCNTTVQ